MLCLFYLPMLVCQLQRDNPKARIDPVTCLLEKGFLRGDAGVVQCFSLLKLG
jgi:hypothetical protein